MKHAIALLCAATLLAGCSTLGDVFKKTGQILMDPSIQVGTAEEQPTQIALSLYASADVNPNPVSRPTAAPVEDVEPLPLDVEDDGPFAVSLRSANKGELVEHLRALLGHLENDQTGSPSALAVQQRSAIPGLVVDEQAPALTLGKTLPETLFTSTATSRGPFPANWMLRQGQAKPVTEQDHGNASMHKLDLGQYSRGAGLAQAADARATPITATPIAFRVMQLKDDSMLENVNPELLRIDPRRRWAAPSWPRTTTLGHRASSSSSSSPPSTRRPATSPWWPTSTTPMPNAGTTSSASSRADAKYPLMVMLQATRVAITDESYRPVQGNFCPAPKRVPTNDHPQSRRLERGPLRQAPTFPADRQIPGALRQLPPRQPVLVRFLRVGVESGIPRLRQDCHHPSPRRHARRHSVRHPHDQPPPEPLAITNAGAANQTVYLTLQLRSDGTAQVRWPDTYGNTRYVVHTEDVRDTHSHQGNHVPLDLAVPNLQLALERDDRSAFTGLALGRILDLRPDGSLLMDAGFYITGLHLHAIRPLAHFMEEISSLMHERAKSIAQRIGSPGQSGVADFTDFNLLQALNRWQHQFRHMARDRTCAPSKPTWRVDKSAASWPHASTNHAWPPSSPPTSTTIPRAPF